MEKNMKNILTAISITVLFGAGASAFAEGKNDVPANNWGQEVKACNLSDCYPGGMSRGEYVRVQAQDDQEPGYGWEIHALVSPGKSDPAFD